MKTHPRFLLFSLSVLLSTSTVLSQWTPTNGPYGGYVNCLAAHGTDLLTGTYSAGLFRSTDNGVSWIPRHRGIEPRLITVLATDGVRIFAGTSNGVVHSIDSGQSWSSAELSSYWIQSLVVAPNGSGGSDVFAGASGAGLFRSTDSGLSWLPVDTSLPASGVMALAWTNGDLFAGIWQRGVYRSTDAGGHWTPVVSGLDSSYRITAVVSRGDTLFAGTSNGLFYASTNKGGAWVRLNSSKKWGSIRAFVPAGSNLLVGTSGGVYRSTDNGTTWALSNTGLIDPEVNTLLAYPGSETVVLGGPSGMYRSTDGGLHWMEANAGLTGLEVYAIAHLGGGGLFAGTVSSGLYRTANGGGTWAPFGTGLPENVIRDLLAVDGVTAYAATGEGLFQSTDYAATWTRSDSGFSAQQVCAIAENGTDLLIGTEDGGMFRSTDGGISWTESNTGLTNRKVFSLAAGSNYIFAGSDSGVFRSSDNGGSWVPVSENLYNLYVSKLALSSAGTGDTVLLAGTWSSIYYSTDYGTTWTQSPSSGGGHVWDFLVNPRHTAEGTVFAATTMGILVSTDNGVTWTHADEGLADLAVLSLEVDGDYLLAGFYGGPVWKRPLSEMVVTGMTEGKTLPGSFRLEQNYPNPFNPTTKIRYSVGGVVAPSGASPRGVGGPAVNRVRLVVYDLLGRQVATLVDEVKSPGSYEVRFSANGGSASGGDASGLASGVYIYRMTTGSFVASRKMMLIK